MTSYNRTDVPAEIFQRKIDDISMALQLLTDDRTHVYIDDVCDLMGYARPGLMSQIISWVAKRDGYAIYYEQSNGQPIVISVVRDGLQ